MHSNITINGKTYNAEEASQLKDLFASEKTASWHHWEDSLPNGTTKTLC